MASDKALRDLILASNPVAYFPLDNMSNLGFDASVNAGHGTPSGNFSQATMKLFDMDLLMTKGGANALVTVQDRPEFRGNKLTIELVVANVGDNNLVWLERGGQNRNWSVQSIASAQQAGIQPSISTFIGTPQTPAIFQGGAVNLQSVSHIVLLMDGATLRTATNGAINPTAMQTGQGNQLDGGNIPVHLFSRAGSYGADGYMAHIAIYNRLLTPEEISVRQALLLGTMGFKKHTANILAANQEPRSQFQPQDVAWRGTPPFYPGPVNLQQKTQYPLCKGRDYFWIRDGVRNVEQGYIESTVTISGVGVRRRVLCFTQDGELVGETYSRASDGVYRFDLLWLNKRYMLVAQDDPAFGPADYNAVAADYQAPKPYPPGGGVAPAPFPMLAPLKRK
ncbi:hypothetical protein RJO76_000818 [Aeromonas veronii]|nr:hypothetical protein [Aeromonas veronii]